MVSDRFSQVCAAHLLLVRDNKILLMRRKNTGYEDGKYSVVAGHIEASESAKESMIREALEETGIKIEIGDLRMVHLMHRMEGDERVDIFFTADKWNGEPSIMEEDKCDDLQWVEFDKVPENTVPYVKQAIDCFSKNLIYSERGWKD